MAYVSHLKKNNNNMKAINDSHHHMFLILMRVYVCMYNNIYNTLQNIFL